LPTNQIGQLKQFNYTTVYPLYINE
jgi:hypothetical protein